MYAEYTQPQFTFLAFYLGRLIVNKDNNASKAQILERRCNSTFEEQTKEVATWEIAHLGKYLWKVAAWKNAFFNY